MKEPFVITIDMDKKCIRCGEKGALESGYCMKCAGKLIFEMMEKRERSVF